MKNLRGDKVVYDLKSIKLPYMSGWVLGLFTRLLEGALQKLLIPSLFESAGVTWLREQIFDEEPTLKPFSPSSNIIGHTAQLKQSEWPEKNTSNSQGFKFESVQDFAMAYREGKITPLEVANNVLNAIEEKDQGDTPLRAIISVNRQDVLKQAEEATQRIQNNEALSILDGVPVAVKDELDMFPYPTTVGTAFLGKTPCDEDATVVARMRAAGALLIGKANMHEIGIGVTGLNPTYGAPQNPYAFNHYPGGSSSGPGVSVAAGLSPIALGADGGGSIRIPAAFCGVVGLKATFGRVSEYGAAPLCWSVAHVGPLTATVADAALAYAIIAGPDEKDAASMHQPMPEIAGWNEDNLEGMKLGIYPEWFQHADSEIVASNEAMLKKFEARGAKIVEISIPDLEAARVAHVITIASEMAQALDETYANHHQEHGQDVRINLALARNFKSIDYIKAQRVRTRMISHLNAIFEKIDVIVTPTTGLVSQPIRPEALKQGQESDLTALTEIMRFVTLANLTGNPAISFPVGYTKNGLPIGMQGIGRGWEEAVLLRLAFNAEQELVRKSPLLHEFLLAK